MNYELHPLCTLFPRLADDDFARLVEDIRKFGLHEPITLHNGMILDGGNRYRACLEAGETPRFKEFEGNNIVSFVFSANLERRHLTAGQRGAIIAAAQDWEKSFYHGGSRTAEGIKDQVAMLPLDTIEQRAKEANVSPKTQRKADKVAKADPDLIKQVACGDISLSKAVEKVTGKPRAKAKIEFRTETDKFMDDPLNKIETLTMAIEELSEENERLRNIVASMVFDGNDEQKSEHLARLNDLTSQNRTLVVANRALTSSRDSLMGEANELRRHLGYFQRKEKNKNGT